MGNQISSNALKGGNSGSFLDRMVADASERARQPRNTLAHAEVAAIASGNDVDASAYALSTKDLQSQLLHVDVGEIGYDLHMGEAMHVPNSDLMDIKGDDVGTCKVPVKDSLKWGVESKEAGRLSCFNRHYVTYWDQTNFKKQLSKKLTAQTEDIGATKPRHYWDKSGPSGNSESLHTWKKHPEFLADAEEAEVEGRKMVFYDSVSNKPVFVAPRGRDMKSFMQETKKNGKPMFTPEEVVQDNVRILPDGAIVTTDGAHLGAFKWAKENNGKRFTVNLTAIAGQGESKAAKFGRSNSMASMMADAGRA
jgi:hypothetical protein